jgi:hypothetical protein
VVSPEGRVFGRPGNRQALNRAYQYLDLVPKRPRRGGLQTPDGVGTPARPILKPLQARCWKRRQHHDSHNFPRQQFGVPYLPQHGRWHGFRANFPSCLRRHLRVALRHQRGADNCLVRIHVGDASLRVFPAARQTVVTPPCPTRDDARDPQTGRVPARVEDARRRSTRTVCRGRIKARCTTP